MILQFGIASGAVVFTSQYWGRKNLSGLKKITAMAMVTALFFSFVFLCAAFFIPGRILSLYSADPQVISLGKDYLKIVSFTYILTALIMVYSNVMRSMSNVFPALLCSFGAISLNTFLNYCLIFGNFGLPKMGVKGAAAATLVSRFAEFIMITAYVHTKPGVYNFFSKKRITPALGAADFLLIKISDFKVFLKKAMPVIFNELGWGTGTSIYFMIFARVGTSAVAAYTIADQIMNLSMVIFFGTCQACSVIIGNSIGGGRIDQARKYARTFMRTGLYMGITIGLILYFVMARVCPLLCPDPQVLSNCLQILGIFCLVLPLKGINFHTIVGCLRGGGDTFFGMFLEISGLWLIGIPLAVWAAFYEGLDVKTIYCLLCFEEVFKVIMSIWRIKSDKWINLVCF
jgi:putative MATE family efflux protein